MNQWCIKKDKNVFKLAFIFHAFPEIPEMLETYAHKKHNFQHYCETMMSQIIVFWSNREIKMPQNVVFRPDCGVKIPRNSKIVKKTRENAAKILCRENFLPLSVVQKCTSTEPLKTWSSLFVKECRESREGL